MYRELRIENIIQEKSRIGRKRKARERKEEEKRKGREEIVRK